jgi:hypothetical protein
MTSVTRPLEYDGVDNSNNASYERMANLAQTSPRRLARES